METVHRKIRPLLIISCSFISIPSRLNLFLRHRAEQAAAPLHGVTASFKLTRYLTATITSSSSLPSRARNWYHEYFRPEFLSFSPPNFPRIAVPSALCTLKSRNPTGISELMLMENPRMPFLEGLGVLKPTFSTTFTSPPSRAAALEYQGC